MLQDSRASEALCRLWYQDQPLNADGREEADPDEVSCYGGEGPEEVLPQVGLLQREVLVGLQAGCHLCQWVGVTLVESLLPKILVLESGREAD